MAKRAFTLVELLVVIAIILVLVSILVPVIGSKIAQARLTACMTNMSTIAKAIGSWQATSSKSQNGKLAFPLVFTEGNPNTTATGTSNDIETLDSAKPNAMQNVYRLIAEEYVPDIAFHCPSDTNGWAPRTSSDKYGWVSAGNFSYGIQWPYASQVADTAPLNKAPIATNLAPGMVIMADRNPLTAAGVDNVDNRNHKDGVVVMTADRNVDFKKHPSTASPYTIGFKSDNIYKNAAGTAGGIPQNATDTSITPCPAR
ncbi:MAG: type II secretion system protein [Planctomycetaceae bacterium]|nr:type II secretion system GspH family protein [Planctomycetaceae bacterium]